MFIAAGEFDKAYKRIKEDALKVGDLSDTTLPSTYFFLVHLAIAQAVHQYRASNFYIGVTYHVSFLVKRTTTCARLSAGKRTLCLGDVTLSYSHSQQLILDQYLVRVHCVNIINSDVARVHVQGECTVMIFVAPNTDSLCACWILTVRPWGCVQDLDIIFSSVIVLLLLVVVRSLQYVIRTSNNATNFRHYSRATSYATRCCPWPT